MWQVISLIVLVPAFTVSFDNNACTRLQDYRFSLFNSNCFFNPDAYASVSDISRRHGYKEEEHTIITNDGYILTLFRVSSRSGTSKGPVYLLHGITLDAEIWVFSGQRSLAFHMADQEFDVWIGSVRGTRHCLSHTTLNSNDSNYWNYNLDTITREDVNAQLNFIFETTQKKILIVGYSMGTTLSFMYTSEYAENAKKIVKGLFALAPVVYTDGVPFMESLKPAALEIIDALEDLDIKSLFYPEEPVHSFLTLFCSGASEICYSILSGESKLFPVEDLLLFFSQFPSSVSIYQLKQFFQITESKRFQKFDFGSEENTRIYGSAEPPIYNLSNIQVPVGLFYGKSDVFYTAQVLDRLYREIGSSKKFETAIPVNKKPDFGHIHFVDSNNIVKDLYEVLYEKIKLYIDKIGE